MTYIRRFWMRFKFGSFIIGFILALVLITAYILLFMERGEEIASGILPTAVIMLVFLVVGKLLESWIGSRAGQNQEQTEFGQYTMVESFNKANELYVLTYAVVKEFNMLWPGHDNENEERKAYLRKVDELSDTITTMQSVLPTQIIQCSNDILKGIAQYRSGRDLRTMAAETRDLTLSREGGHEMTAGAKKVGEAWEGLTLTIREIFGVDRIATSPPRRA